MILSKPSLQNKSILILSEIFPILMSTRMPDMWDQGAIFRKWLLSWDIVVLLFWEFKDLKTTRIWFPEKYLNKKILDLTNYKCHMFEILERYPDKTSHVNNIVIISKSLCCILVQIFFLYSYSMIPSVDIFVKTNGNTNTIPFLNNLTAYLLSNGNACYA